MPKLWFRAKDRPPFHWYGISYPFDDDESKQAIAQLREYCRLVYGKVYTYEELVPILMTLIDHGVS
jgi:hypothetical protein